MNSRDTNIRSNRSVFRDHAIVAGLMIVLALVATAQAPAASARGLAPVSAEGEAQSSDKAEKDKLPLEGKTEEISFRTDEATWISLDVTPDGEAIVFELLGDIYRVPMAGGEATRLTEGLGYDSQPRVSPDGRRMAFISDRNGADNLWISNIDGSEPKKLTSEKHAALASPVWTPDSQYIVVTQGRRNVKFRMFNIDGGGGMDLAGKASSGNGSNGGSKNGVGGMGAAFSPDGNYLYFSKSVDRGPQVPRFPGAQISRFDMRTGDVDGITQGEGGGLRPLISPDGRLLVYATREETKTGLRVRDLQTGADRRLIWPIQRDSQERGRTASRDLLPGYAFTPDGANLIVAYEGKIHRVEIATGNAVVIPFSADVALDVGPDLSSPYRVEQGPVKATIVHDPVFSPDGSKLAMSILTKIHVMDADSAAEPARLTSGDAWEFKPVWSPDGRSIAYVTWSMNDGGHIWKMRANGRGAPQRLTSDPAFYTDLVFSPDGTRIVAMRGNEYMRHQTFSEFGGLAVPVDLVWLPADGGEVSLISPGRGNRTPHFTGDPDRIYSYSDKGLVSVRYDGSDQRMHLQVEGPSVDPEADSAPKAERVLIRPDGKWALALVNKQIWVAPIPLIGGKELTINVSKPAVPVARLTDIGADFMAWADGGDTITWAIGSTVYRRPFSSIEFGEKDKDEPAKKSEGEAEKEPKRPLDMDDAVEAIAVTLTAPRAKPTGTVVLRGAAVIQMADGDTKSMESVLANADLVVTDNRIVAIGPQGTLSVPEGARIIDVSGKFIMPGFIDTHAHWEFRTGDVLEPQNWSLQANLAYGVTAGLDVQTSHKDYFAYRDMVETGQSLGQRAFMTGPGVFGNNDFQSYEATLAYLKRYTEHYRTKNIKSYVVGNRKQRQWVVMASKELGLMPTTEGAGDFKLDITHAIDGMHGNEHTLPDSPIFKDIIELYARTKTAYTPTLLVQYNGVRSEEYFFSRTEVHDDAKLNRFYPHNRLDELTRRRQGWVRDDEFNFDEAAAQAAKIQRAGGLVGVGGHGELEGLGYHWEMWSLAMGGMTPVEVLRAATIDGARIIGIEQDLGSLEVGKLADLVVLDANPLEDIRNTNTISLVMKNGELYDGDTLNQIWPIQKELPAFWWWPDSE